MRHLSLEQRVLLVRLGRQVLLDRKDPKALQVLMERMEHQAHLVPPDLLGLRANLDNLVRRVLPAAVPALELIKILVPKKECLFSQRLKVSLRLGGHRPQRNLIYPFIHQIYKFGLTRVQMRRILEVEQCGAIL